MNILILILGLVLVIAGAEFLVRGAVSVAQRHNMPEFLIGLTVVGIGTSMPELVVSLIAGLKGSGSIAIGNVIGSNLANILLIIGVAGLIRPIPVSPSANKIDIPFNILVSIILLFMCFGFTFWKGGMQTGISRMEGIVLLALFIGFMTYSFRSANRGKDSKTPDSTDKRDNQKHIIPVWKSVIFILCGLAGLIFGGRWFVSGASSIAASLGISETIIAITVVAVGTSLPELATSVVAAIKGNTQLALGNIIGSNIFNICLILGITATVTPLDTLGITPVDIIATITASVMLWLSVYTFKGRSVNRADAAIFLLTYIGYIAYLIVR